MSKCDLRPECTKMQFRNRIFIDQKKEHLTGKIDGFNGLATLIERLDKSGGVILTDMLIFEISIWT